MTSSLPNGIQEVFERFITTEYVTVDAGGQPIAWPVTPYYHAGEGCIDVTTGLGYPKKANDARANPRVALLFSDPTGCGVDGAPMVLVQGTARVDDADLRANADRYARESVLKLPATKAMMPPKAIQRTMQWYFTRLYVHVRPERVYVWRDADPATEPELYDTHIEEVRSGHVEEPEVPHPGPVGAAPEWDPRLDELDERYDTAVLAVTAPDGFPFAVRVPVSVDRAARRVKIAGDQVGVPVEPGLACLTAHDHAPDFTWQRNFQVRGDLVVDDDGWALVPRKLVGGFELPPGSNLARMRLNFGKMRRFRKIAKRELERMGR